MKLFTFTQNITPALLHLATAQDRILLREEAVYLMKTTLLNSAPCPVCCLALDAAVRGVTISEPFTALNDSQWLELVLQAEQQL